ILGGHKGQFFQILTDRFINLQSLYIEDFSCMAKYFSLFQLLTILSRLQHLEKLSICGFEATTTGPGRDTAQTSKQLYPLQNIKCLHISEFYVKNFANFCGTLSCWCPLLEQINLKFYSDEHKT